MLVICPTADYEIYLGKNYLPVEEVIFEPTRKLLELWAEFGVKSTLFPDICSVWRYRELGVNGYPDAFEDQIKQAALDGHDIQLHLHPEWRFAEYRDQSWHFRSGTHALHDLGFSSDDPESARGLIRKGKRYLENLLQGDNPDYRCIAFRAGGWLIQPETELISVLLSEGIRVDATVIPDVQLLRTDYKVDFRNVPDQPTWHVSPDTGLSRDSKQKDDLLEISIGAYRGNFPLWHHVINEIRLRKRAKTIPQEPRGIPIVKIEPKQKLLTRLKKKYRKLTIPRALDIADTHESMLKTLASYLRRYDCLHNDFAICMHGHPKDTYDYHLVELRRFFDAVHRRYGNMVKFQPISTYVENMPDS